MYKSWMFPELLYLLQELLQQGLNPWEKSVRSFAGRLLLCSGQNLLLAFFMLQLPENDQNYCTCKQQHNKFYHEEVCRLVHYRFFLQMAEGLKRESGSFQEW